jgi:hypothetical protein
MYSRSPGAPFARGRLRGGRHERTSGSGTGQCEEMVGALGEAVFDIIEAKPIPAQRITATYWAEQKAARLFSRAQSPALYEMCAHRACIAIRVL